jgi:hypothetical protein
MLIMSPSLHVVRYTRRALGANILVLIPPLITWWQRQVWINRRCRRRMHRISKIGPWEKRSWTGNRRCRRMHRISKIGPWEKRSWTGRRRMQLLVKLRVLRNGLFNLGLNNCSLCVLALCCFGLSSLFCFFGCFSCRTFITFSQTRSCSGKK